MFTRKFSKWNKKKMAQDRAQMTLPSSGNFQRKSVPAKSSLENYSAYCFICK